MKDKKMLFGIGIAFLFLATIGFSYAYFSSAIIQNDVKDQIVTTGTLSLRYVDGPEIKMENIKPGQTIIKTVYVANTGTLDASYNLVWQELTNEITNDEMVLEATCTRMNGQTEEVDGTCNGIENSPIGSNIINKNVSIEPNIVHKYDITITFKEINAEQNYNQNKMFNGVIGIEEYKNDGPIYCTFDGELTQGAEYVNGQYTYRYRQSGASFADELAWSNMIEYGWGVQLTNKASTNPVSDQVCTYINDKPVVSARNMFENSKASTIDLSSFDTSKVTDMYNMFSNSQATVINVSNFDTSKVTNMSSMFKSSQATTLDLSSFDTSEVIIMSYMFQNSKVTTLDLSNFDTSKVEYMSYMFDNSQAAVINVSNFDTSKVTDMSSMFNSSQATTLDLSSFDTSKVTKMGGLFNNCINLTTIYASSKFNISNIISSYTMFHHSTKLVGGAGTVYDSTKVDKTYARIDGGTSSPGYFTLKQ